MASTPVNREYFVAAVFCWLMTISTLGLGRWQVLPTPSPYHTEVLTVPVFNDCNTTSVLRTLYRTTRISHQHYRRTSIHLITAAMLIKSRISASCFLQSYNLTVLMIRQLWLYTYVDWIVPVSPSILSQPCCKWFLLMVNITSWKISKTWQLITNIYQRPAHAHQQICTQLMFSLMCKHTSFKDKKIFEKIKCSSPKSKHSRDHLKYSTETAKTFSWDFITTCCRVMQFLLKNKIIIKFNNLYDTTLTAKHMLQTCSWLLNVVYLPYSTMCNSYGEN